MSKIAVMGAGAWGTALAIQASQRHAVTLWARDADHANRMLSQRLNSSYLPGHNFPEGLMPSHAALPGLAQHADLVVLAVPMAALRQVLLEVSPFIQDKPLVWLCKGFEAVKHTHNAYGLMAHEVQAQVAPAMFAGVLSGPSFAQEVAAGQPTALVAASRHALVRQALVNAFHADKLRVYANDDVVGVETGGAVKNVLAIATGLCDGLQLGLNARAALITRGLAEMTRLGVALGARRETLMGLAGLGDLVLTCTDDQSRNRRFGLLLAAGRTPQMALAEIGQVVEGYLAARAVHAVSHREGVDMPICEGIYRLLYEGLPAREVVKSLLSRPIKAEFIE